MKSRRLLTEKKHANTHINSFSVGRRPMFCVSFVVVVSFVLCLPFLANFKAYDIIRIVGCDNKFGVGLMISSYLVAGSRFELALANCDDRLTVADFLSALVAGNASTCRKSSNHQRAPLARSLIPSNGKSPKNYFRIWASSSLPLFPF